MSERRGVEALEARIAQLETRISGAGISLDRLAAFSEGDCTNGCTHTCTGGCTGACTGGCVQQPEIDVQRLITGPA